jgi:ParB family transcriptional regulator, chromosome partitioning protein
MGHPGAQDDKPFMAMGWWKRSKEHEEKVMTTAAATNKAAPTADKDKDREKEKVEKRRALGRGLESLLPGPRVVAGTAVRPATAPAPAQQVPHSVRNDKPEGAAAEQPLSTPAGTVPVIRAVVEDQTATTSETAELRSAGQTGAADPTDAVAEAPAIPQAESGFSIMAQAESRIPGNLVINIALSDIDKNPFQTRYVHKNEALEELADSIRINGVVQPIVVRPAPEDGRYVLILGERRLHASKLAGKETIPAIVRRVSDQQAAEMTIIENLQREDLSPLEQAEAFRVLSEEFKMTQSQIGERIGLSRESVANYMRLLRLPEATMKFLALGDISFATAKELLKLEDKDMIAKAAAHIVEKGMTFDQVERMVWQMMGVLDPVPGLPGQEKKRSGARWVDPNVRAAQTELERLLGVKVRIRDRKGKGKIVIEYHTVDDYDRVVGMLQGKTG